MTEQTSMDGSLPVVHLGTDSFWTAARPSEGVPGVGGYIKFQHGPIQEAGANGTTIELVTQAIIARLEGFQRGPFASDYNERALSGFRFALVSLEERTRDRQVRGVEGKNEV